MLLSTVQQLVSSFDWNQEVEPASSVNKAIDGIESFLLDHALLTGDELADFKQTVLRLIFLTHEQYQLLFNQTTQALVYHNSFHSLWTAIHALRSYCGLAKLNKRFDSQVALTIFCLGLLHELDDWWLSVSKRNIVFKQRVLNKIEKIITQSGVDLITFYQLLAFCNQQPLISKEELKHTRYLNFTSNPFKFIQINDLSVLNISEQIFEPLLELVVFLKAADYSQCLHENYLTQIDLLDGQITNLGPVVLAVEFLNFRIELLKLFGWERRKKIDWTKVSCGIYFYQEFFTPNLIKNNYLAYLDQFYGSDFANPYRHRLEKFKKLIRK